MKRKSSASRNGDNKSAASSNQILLFKILDNNNDISEYLFGMSISQIMQILEPQEIIRVPGSLDFVYGLINWRNRPVPVIDLYKRICLKDSQINDQTRFVVAGTLSKGLIVCFPVYLDVNVKKLPLPHEKLVLDSGIDISFTKGTFKVEDYTLVIPDLDKIVFRKIENLN
jgi:chemotaxis signal transduction protein